MFLKRYVRKMTWLFLGIVLVSATLVLIQVWVRPGLSGQAAGVPVYGYRIIKAYPHDPRALTQGLIYRDGFLFESTGLRGRSTLRKVRLETGVVLQQHTVDPKYFAEGLTAWENTLIQLTWKSSIGFLYDLASLKVKGTFRYPGEGWGLTSDQHRLIMSDGSATLRFLDPTTFHETGHLTVRDGYRSVANLNELEFLGGEIYANIWKTDRIVRISPHSGQVTGWIDLRGLLPEPDQGVPVDVLNGIAYDAVGDRLFITGKLWPKLFEIKLVHHG